MTSRTRKANEFADFRRCYGSGLAWRPTPSRASRGPSKRRYDRRWAIPPRPEGKYDIRRGAAGYSPVIGTFGALAVPAIILVFPLGHTRGADAPLIALAAGLLIAALIGSITSAIGLAAIGAEQDLTANLVPAAMYLAVAASVSLISMLAAFEVLAALDLNSLVTMFALITGVAGWAGVFFTALSIADSWHTGPSNPAEKTKWQRSQWIREPEQGDRRTLHVLGVSSLPVATGIVLRAAHIHVTPNSTGVAWLVGVTLALSMLAVGAGAFRTRHSTPQKGLRWQEAYGTTVAIGLYTLVMMIFIPVGY
jgi:hypothetical protein